jgi:TM2 domain-containing membrane protein YozV
MVGHPTTPPPVSGKAQSSQQWKIAAALAFAGALSPLPIPISGLHKFYLRQPVWGGIYLLLGWTGIPRIACAVEGVWLLVRSQNDTPAAIPSMKVWPFLSRPRRSRRPCGNSKNCAKKDSFLNKSLSRIVGLC